MNFRFTTQAMIDSSLAYFYYEEAKDKSRWKTPEMSHENALVIKEAVDRLHDLAKKFEREVWFNGLQKITNDCRVRGMKGEYDGITFMSWCCAGRCMMTITAKDGDWITLITADDEEPHQRDHHMVKPNPDHWGPMGIQGIDATESVAAGLITTVTEHWKEFDIHPDTEVTIAIPLPPDED